jgi:two-component system C4-dicarboxylate transport response regulator DctD
MSMINENGPVVVVEDDAVLREATLQALELAGLAAEGFENATRAARYLIPSFQGCVVTDIRMDEMDGMQLFARIRDIDPEIPVILMTGHGEIEMAVRAMHDGAFDFLAKPFATDHLVAVVRKALQSRRLVLDNRALRKAIDDTGGKSDTQSRIVEKLRISISQVAQTNIDVQIVGEPGSGKEYWAAQLHHQSRHYASPFIVRTAERFLNEADLLDVEQACRGGTLYLEECEGLNQENQSKLSGLLDIRERRSLDNSGAPGFRLVVATRDDPEPASLSSTLMHRIGAVRLRIPPLRERREDIPTLFAGFVRDAIDQTGKKKFEMSAADRKRLLEHDWPGNIRELRNYAFGAVLNLPREALSATISNTPKNLSARINSYEKMLLTEALELTGGHVVRTCELLGVARKTLYEKLSRYGIDPARFRKAAGREN